MSKFFTIFVLIIIIFGLTVVVSFLTTAKADVGRPTSITATYNSNTGQLYASGSLAWEECEPGEETNVLGYALFTNGGTPAYDNSDALDGSGMHLSNGGNGCTTTPDNWTDSHILSSMPSTVCLVVYDVRTDDSADPGGIHSITGAGGNYNTDNSWDTNDKSYSEGSCTVPVVIVTDECDENEDQVCSSPTPTPTVIPTPTPTPTPVVITEKDNGFPQPCNGCGGGESSSTGGAGAAVTGQVLGLSATNSSDLNSAIIATAGIICLTIGGRLALKRRS